MYANNRETGFPQRRVLRLRGYDYRWPGSYFVTICTHGRQSLFGNITNGCMNLNMPGRLVQTC